MVALNFNARQVAPGAALEALPSGVYPVMITASVEKPNSKNTGTYIEFELTIQHPDPKLNGRKLYDRLNIRNPNQQAVDIAYGTLSAICHVTGRYDIQDTQQLHGIPMQAVVQKVARDDRPGEFSNDVKGYKDAQGNDPGASAGGAGGPSPGPQNGGGSYAGPGGQPQQYQPQGNGQAPQGGGYGGPPVGQQYQGQAGGGAPAVHQTSDQHYAGQAGAPQPAGPGGTPPWAQNGGGQQPQPQGQQAQQPAPQQAAPQGNGQGGDRPPWAQGPQ